MPDILSRIPRAIYEIGYIQFAGLSMAFNVVKYKGSRRQTLSARAHFDGRTDPEWAERERRIDRAALILTLGYNKNHCAGAWDSEVTRARKTLQRNGDFAA